MRKITLFLLALWLLSGCYSEQYRAQENAAFFLAALDKLDIEKMQSYVSDDSALLAMNDYLANDEISRAEIELILEILRFDFEVGKVTKEHNSYLVHFNYPMKDLTQKDKDIWFKVPIVIEMVKIDDDFKLAPLAHQSFFVELKEHYSIIDSKLNQLFDFSKGEKDADNQSVKTSVTSNFKNAI